MAQKDLRMKGDHDRLVGDYEIRIGLYLGILDWPLFIRILDKIIFLGDLSTQVSKVPVCRNTKECKRWKTMETIFYSTICKKFSICSQVAGEGGRRWKLLMPCANSEVPQGIHLLFDNSSWLFGGGVHSVLASLLKWACEFKWFEYVENRELEVLLLLKLLWKW